MKSTIRPHFSFGILPAILATGIFAATLNAAPNAMTIDPAVAKQLSDARAKAAQLELLFAQNAPRSTATPMPNMPASASSASPMPNMSSPGAMKSSGMGDDKMMGKMDMMMQKMDKMMPMMERMMGGGMKGGMSGSGISTNAPASGMSGGGTGMEDDNTEMAGMMGMGAMGNSSAMNDAALPGFPGASHLYHIGATGFFLDHPEHISLTTDQQVALNKIKDEASLAKSAADRNIEKAEQELGTLTAADQPDTSKIEAKVREIAKMAGDQRLAFIRAVGEAAKLLTPDQRKSLTGFAPPAPAMPITAPAASATPMPMNDM